MKIRIKNNGNAFMVVSIGIIDGNEMMEVHPLNHFGRIETRLREFQVESSNYPKFIVPAREFSSDFTNSLLKK